MRATAQYLRMLILNAVANDFESFETIAKQVTAWAIEDGTSISLDEIKRELCAAIRERCVDTFNLSVSSRPKVIKFDPKQIDDVWFYRTAAGLELLKKEEQ